MSLPRYPDYKGSGVAWLGQVPGHWDVSSFKRLVDIQNGADHKHIEQDSGYPVIGSGGPFAFASEYMFDGESVLLGRKGTIDRPLYVSGKFWTVDTMYWTKIAPDVCGRFAYYVALDIPFAYYSTNTALPSMTKGALHAHLIARPPLLEQTQIAAFLDRETAKIDALVAEQRRLMELLKEKRQAVISHAVTKGQNPGAPMKASGIEWLGDVPEQWDVVPAKFVARIGNGSTPNRDTPDYWLDGNYPWLSSTVVNNDQVTEADEFVTARALSQCHLPIVYPPAILIGITGQGRTRGMAATLLIEATINQHIAFVKPISERVDVLLLRRVFDMAYPYLRRDSDAGGSTKGAITCSQIGNFKIAVPPRGEQLEIIARTKRLSFEFDTLTAEAQRAIDLLQERRTALISAAVTGQIDVRGAVAV